MPRKPRKPRQRSKWPPTTTPEDRNVLGAMLMALEEAGEARALGLLRLIVTKEWETLKDYHKRLGDPEARTYLERAAHAHGWVYRAAGENKDLTHSAALRTRAEALAALEQVCQAYEKRFSKKEALTLGWKIAEAYELYKSGGHRQPSMWEMVGHALCHPSPDVHYNVARLYMRLSEATDTRDVARHLYWYTTTVAGRALLARLEADEAA
jgi:hypothetical protein